MADTEMETEKCYDQWVLTSDFDKEEQYYYRRLQLRGYYKDLSNLVGITSD